MPEEIDLPDCFPPSKLGEYTVIQDIAEGTFGKVKMAMHTITGHKVAMKYISKAVIQREKTKTRVKREFEYMRTLRHPHIIKLYEVISTPTDIIFVLEYAGGELFNYIVANGRMPEPRARRFFQQIISGIEHSHRYKIVHRDLKPENVLLDDDLNVKIADFGLSNEISDGDFLTTSCGSPNYAAPEVIRGGVGVILYVMLCGRLPFEDDDVQMLFTKISQGSFHIPSYLSPDAKSLIQGMLTVDPMKRITIPDITQHPFFTTDLPRYLSPLPPAPGPVLGTLSTLVLPPKQLDFEIIEGLGRIEEDVVDELARKLEGVEKDEVWEALRRDDGTQGNAIKVAYMLLRDKRRLGKDLSIFAEQERDAELAAMDPRNALSPALSPSTGEDQNPFEAEFNASPHPPSLLPQLPNTRRPPLPSPPTENPNFAVLNSSLPAKDANGKEEHHLASFEKRQHKIKWHFGIRSRSPPMEVILGMEWKEKRDLGGLGGRNRDLDGSAAGIYFVETRARVQDVVVLMNLQLYMVDSINYLVDFHHKRTYKASTEPGAGKFDMASPDMEDGASVSTTGVGSVGANSVMAGSGGGGENEVVSPFVFMDVACRLILELAGGGE
ncbi:kinase-like domain-containing protein [Cyathus striatus]|nr:kinase-like domain-containing protein [Cyathus striatus]